MEGSSAFQFGRAAYRAGMVSRRQLAADAWANLRFRMRGSTDEASHALRDRICSELAGTRVRDLERLGADVLAGVLPRIYPRMLALAHEHQDAGRRVYIVTAASQELADVLAHVLALDGAVGSQFSEVQDGVFTGRPTGLFIYGADKARAIEQLAEHEGVDLASSYAYSDSTSDLPMLRVVGHPVAVNPDRELARGAIVGDSYGMLKLLVSNEDLKLLGVHIFGTAATELVHIGQAVMGCGGTIEYLVDAVINYPTFSEAYKVAALDVMNKMRALNQFRA